MVEVIANTKGYIDGTVRELGERFTVSDELWKDEKRRPKWVRPAKSELFGGKGDHDGDGTVGGSKPSIPAGEEKPQEKHAAAPATGKAGKPKGNGVQEELGGPAPDWIIPGDQPPQPVAD
ncbi:hypothetical protein ACVIRO_001049 [Rhizobium ruizarguesonis]